MLAVYGLIGVYFLLASTGSWRGVAPVARAAGLASIGADLFGIYGAMRWSSLGAVNATDGALRGAVVGLLLLSGAGLLLATLG